MAITVYVTTPSAVEARPEVCAVGHLFVVLPSALCGVFGLTGAFLRNGRGCHILEFGRVHALQGGGFSTSIGTSGLGVDLRVGIRGQGVHGP